MRLALIIPAYDEAGAIGTVVSGFAAITEPGGAPVLDEIVVVDNNSADATADVASAAGATVIHEARPGYGSACLAGMRYLRDAAAGPPFAVVFADGDGSNDPADLPALVAPILAGTAELVIGARPRRADPGSLTLPQRFGNLLATRMLRHYFGAHFTDLGPFRVIRWDSLERIRMADPDFGWTVEMQVKAAKASLRMREVDVANRARIAGKSKVSGTLEGVYGAGTKIIGTILQHR